MGLDNVQPGKSTGAATVCKFVDRWVLVGSAASTVCAGSVVFAAHALRSRDKPKRKKDKSLLDINLSIGRIIIQFYQ